MNDHVEVGIEQQDAVGPDGGDVKTDGDRGAVERVGEQRGLNHDERPQDALAVEHQPEEGGLVGAVVEDLEEGLKES